MSVIGQKRTSESRGHKQRGLLLPLSAILDLSSVVDLIDSLYFLMAIPNIVGIYLLAGPLRTELKAYMSRPQKS